MRIVTEYKPNTPNQIRPKRSTFEWENPTFKRNEKSITNRLKIEHTRHGKRRTSYNILREAYCLYNIRWLLSVNNKKNCF